MAKELTKKEKQITQLYFETTLEVGKNADNWISFLKRASYNYKYRFDEQILIYAQKPETIACAETEIWNKKLKRWINKGSKGIALITEREGELGLRFVFDVSDTNSNIYGKKFKLWQVKEQYTNNIIEALEDKFGTMEDKSNLPFAIISTVYNRVIDSMQDYLEDLKTVTANSKLEKLNEKELEETFIGILMYSTIALTMSRCGLDVEKYFSKEYFSEIEKFNTSETMSIIGTATRDFSKEILLEISKTVINLEKVQKQEKNKNYTFEKIKQSIYNKENEKGSVINESNLHTKRELSNTRLEHRENKQESETRQVRQNEIEVSKREQEGNLHNASSEQQINGTPNTNRENSNKQNSTGSRENETTLWNNRGNESKQPNGMGRTDEQYSSNSRTDSNKGSNLQLEEQPNGKEVDNTSFFNGETTNTEDNKDDYTFIVGDIIYIGFQEFTISNIDNQTITMYDNQFPLAQRTIAIKDILEKLAENPMNDYLKDREQAEVEEKIESAFNKWLDTFIEETKEQIYVAEKIFKKNKNIEYFDLHPEIPTEERNNFKITDNNLGIGTAKEKYKNNVEAIKVLKLCEEQKRYATPDEQQILSRYVGWGGLKSVFEDKNDKWANEYAELKELLIEDEYKDARASSVTAYYTPPVVIRNIYKALQNMGLKQANILEPSCRSR